MVRLWVEHGADLPAKDAEGHTPLEVAKIKNLSAMVDILSAAKAATGKKPEGAGGEPEPAGAAQGGRS